MFYVIEFNVVQHDGSDNSDGLY